MRVKVLIFILAICICCLMLPYHTGQAEEEGKECPKPYINTVFPRAAKPGDLVKIQGGRFGRERGEVVFTEEMNSPVDLVFSSGVKAVIRGWTYHRIWVIVPKSATTGPVFVRVPCGSKSNEKDFRVLK